MKIQSNGGHKTSNNKLQELPNELLLLIFNQFEGLIPAVRLGSTCKRFHNLLNNDQFIVATMSKVKWDPLFLTSLRDKSLYQQAKEFTKMREGLRKYPRKYCVYDQVEPTKLSVNNPNFIEANIIPKDFGTIIVNVCDYSLKQKDTTSNPEYRPSKHFYSRVMNHDMNKIMDVEINFQKKKICIKEFNPLSDNEYVKNEVGYGYKPTPPNRLLSMGKINEMLYPSDPKDKSRIFKHYGDPLLDDDTIPTTPIYQSYYINKTNQKGKIVGSWMVPLAGEVGEASFSNSDIGINDKYVVALHGCDRHLIRVYDVASGKPLSPFKDAPHIEEHGHNLTLSSSHIWYLSERGGLFCLDIEDFLNEPKQTDWVKVADGHLNFMSQTKVRIYDRFLTYAALGKELLIYDYINQKCDYKLAACKKGQTIPGKCDDKNLVFYPLELDSYSDEMMLDVNGIDAHGSHWLIDENGKVTLFTRDFLEFLCTQWIFSYNRKEGWHNIEQYMNLYKIHEKLTNVRELHGDFWFDSESFFADNGWLFDPESDELQSLCTIYEAVDDLNAGFEAFGCDRMSDYLIVEPFSEDSYMLKGLCLVLAGMKREVPESFNPRSKPKLFTSVFTPDGMARLDQLCKGH